MQNCCNLTSVKNPPFLPLREFWEGRVRQADMVSMTEEERQFLVSTTARSYGTTRVARKSYKRAIRHTVDPSDTVQGIALRYRSSVVEIKRQNKLFSDESLHLLDTVMVPVYDETIFDEMNVVEIDDIRLASPTTSEKSTSGEFEPSGGAPEVSSYQDIFSRIDSNTKAVADNVKKLSSRIDSIDSGPEDYLWSYPPSSASSSTRANGLASPHSESQLSAAAMQHNNPRLTNLRHSNRVKTRTAARGMRGMQGGGSMDSDDFYQL